MNHMEETRRQGQGLNGRMKDSRRRRHDWGAVSDTFIVRLCLCLQIYSQIAPVTVGAFELKDFC